MQMTSQFPVQAGFSRCNLSVPGDSATAPDSIKLVAFDEDRKQLVVDPTALSLIKTLKKPVAVLSICGPARTGKSYFMSKVIQCDSVFRVSSGFKPCTKGIWMSSSILETEKMAVILLDTEGMGSVQGDQNLHQAVEMFVTLTILLSSYMIYNTMGLPDASLECLGYFGGCSKKMLGRGGQELQVNELKIHFPDFLWLMRDISLEDVKKEDEEPQTLTEYMREKVLMPKGGANIKRDEGILILKEAFPLLSFKQMPHPGKIEAPCEEFKTTLDETLLYILQSIRPTHGLNSEHALTGTTLAQLLEQYVRALNNKGGSVLLEDSHFKAIRGEVSEAIDKLVLSYDKEMRALIAERTIPLEEGDITELISTHAVMVNDRVKIRLATLSRGQKDLSADKDGSVTLFTLHLHVYRELLKSICEKLDKLLPNGSYIELKKELITAFQNRLVIISSSNSSTFGEIQPGCSLMTFLKENYQASKDYCTKLFGTLYSEQRGKNIIISDNMKSQYYLMAHGPAKHQVFQEQMSTIPKPPSDIKVEDVLCTSITVSWAAGDGNISHSVEAYCYKKADPDANPFIQNIYFANSQCKFTTLKPNTEYLIKIRGLQTKTGIFGEFSDPVTIKTIYSVPDKPSPPENVLVNGLNASLTTTLLSDSEQESKGSPVTKMQVQYNFSQTTDWKNIWEVTGAEIQRNISFKLPSLDDAMEISNCNSINFRIIMFNEFGGSEPSDFTSYSFEKCIPGRPTNLRCDDIGSRAATISWQRPAVHRALRIEYELQIDEPLRNESITVWEKKSSVQLTDLRPNTEYSASVKGRLSFELKGGEYGPFSEPLQFKTTSVPDKPLPPQLVSIHKDDPLKATMFITLLSDEQTNGPISKLIVEYKLPSTNWEMLKEYEGEAIQSNVVIPLVSLDDPSYLTGDYSYKFRLIMCNSCGQIELSDSISYSFENVILGRPTNLRCNDIGSRAATISWRRPALHRALRIEYELQIADINEPSRNERITVGEEKSSFKLTDLRHNTEYNVSVKARLSFELNGSYVTGEYGQFSEPLQFKTTSVPDKPLPPQLVSIHKDDPLKATMFITLLSDELTNGPISKLSVEYKLPSTNWELLEEYEGEAIQSNVVIPLVSLDDPRYLTGDYSYKFRLIMCNSCGQIKTSDSTSYFFENVILGRPTNLRCDDIGSRAATISWQRPALHRALRIEYELQIADIDEPSRNERLKVGEEKSSFKLTDLRRNTEYSVSVRARFSFELNGSYMTGEYGQFSEPLQFKTTSVPDKPLPPQLVSIHKDDPLKATMFITLLSDEQTNGSISKLSVEYKLPSTNWELSKEYEGEAIQSNVVIPLVSLDDPRYLTGDYSYKFRLIMCNSCGQNKTSDSTSYFFKNVILGRPTNLRCDDIGSRVATISWQRPALHRALRIEYVLEIADIDEPWRNEDITVGEEQSSFQLEGLGPKTEYSARVKARFSFELNGCYVTGEYGHFSEPLIFITKSVLDKPLPPQLVSIHKDDPLKATMFITLLSDEQTNGCPISKLSVEYKLPSTNWEMLKEFEGEAIHSNVVIPLVSLDDPRYLTGDYSYKFRLIMCNSCGQSKPSDSTSYSFEDVILGRPTNLRCNDIGSRAATVSWRRPALHRALRTVYELQIADIDEPSRNKRKKVGEEKSSFQLEGLGPKTEYSVSVRAKFSFELNSGYLTGEYGLFSEPLIFKTKSVPDKPLPPQLVSIHRKDPLKATMFITLLSDEQTNGCPILKLIVEYKLPSTNYNWEILNEFEGEAIQSKFVIPLVILDDPSYLTGENSCEFRLIMCSSCGQSEPSAPQSLSNLLPSRPTLTLLKASAYSVLIDWQIMHHRAFQIGYCLEYWPCRSTGNEQERLEILTANDREHLLRGLKPNTEYSINIKAKYGSNAFGPSSEIRVKTAVDSYSGLKLELVQANSKQIEVKWCCPTQMEEEVLYYQVECKKCKLDNFAEHESICSRRIVGYNFVTPELESWTWTDCTISVTAVFCNDPLFTANKELLQASTSVNGERILFYTAVAATGVTALAARVPKLAALGAAALLGTQITTAAYKCFFRGIEESVPEYTDNGENQMLVQLLQ